MADILIIHESTLLPQMLAAMGKQVKAYMGPVSCQFHEGDSAQDERAKALAQVAEQAKEKGANAVVVTHDSYYHTTNHYGWHIAGNAILLEDIQEG